MVRSPRGERRNSIGRHNRWLHKGYLAIMWQRRKQQPLVTAGNGRRPHFPAATASGRFEQRLAAKHLMLHWLATEQATAAVDTGRQRIQPTRAGKQVSKVNTRGQEHHATTVAARLTDLLSRCRPIEVPSTEPRSRSANWAQSRLAQMSWCYQGPLRSTWPASPVSSQSASTDFEQEDYHVGGLENGAPYLSFLAQLTEHLVKQPQLSNEALYTTCKRYIAKEGAALDTDMLWALVKELFPDLDQFEPSMS
ncbi:uncharacterized protein LOC144104854 isoform X2 [Amblyomma americanum]